MNDVIYNTLIDEVCESGSIPMNFIDLLCKSAHDQITQANRDNSTRRERIAQRDSELFGWYRQDRSTFSAQWGKYLKENWDNMEMC